jgi:hypothetical protein
MNIGKTLFAQIMDFLPWSTFDRIVARYDGNRAVRKLSCAAQYQVMAFAQLTYRESLRDIEACLSAQTAKLYHMGFREPVRRSTLADANESRDWRIYAEFAQRLIVQARRLYAKESFGLDLTNAVYALDSRPSICACRCSRGRISGQRSPPLRCTRCLICGATFQALSISRMASCTMFMRLIC